MIEIIDNALPLSIFNKFIKKISHYSFPWYIGKDIEQKHIDNTDTDTVCIDDNARPTLQFNHSLYDTLHRPKITSPYFDFFNQPIFDFLQDNKKIGGTLNRSKLNLLTNNHTIKSDNLYNVPHIDTDGPHLSVLIYLNNSDGDTIFFNERCDENKKKPKSLSIKQKISPKQNRMVISDGNYHCSTNPINTEYRIVYNAVFTKIERFN